MDALTLQEGRLLPWVELARRIECVSGRVDVDVRVRPRFDFGRRPTRWRMERGHPVAQGDSTAVSVVTDADGELRAEGGTLTATVSCTEGSRRLLCLVGVDDEPLVFPRLDQVATRIGRTPDFWRQRASAMSYDGPYRDAVVRSGLALQLLISQSSGAIAAAATMALPERIGGSANYDYRYRWVRDASFILDAFMGIGLQAQAHASFTALHVRRTGRIPGSSRCSASTAIPGCPTRRWICAATATPDRCGSATAQPVSCSSATSVTCST